MNAQRKGSNRFIALLLGIVVFALGGAAYADPPGRVARLGYINGPVSFSPAGEEDWVEARINRPLVTGDRLWSDAGARVELQIGSASIRLGATTSVTLLNLDDRVAQFQLAQGTLNVRVRRLDPDQVVEIDTPNLAYVVRQPGDYRISVDPNGDTTEVLTRDGQAEVYGEGASYVVDAGRAYRFFGTGLRDYEALALPRMDEFDRWAQDRDRSYDNSISARYVSRDVIGYQDLDAYGSWRAVPEYGNVWMPTRVSADWAPYHDGHWAWVEPWGWTWVDDAPWGFAVSHYGRWANFGGSWGWIPGPVAARAVYAPALVVFIGGSNFQIAISSGNVGAVGWFPLGPRDVYRPAYPVSRTYFNNVNTSNTVINTTNITNVYNNTNVTNVTYVNQRVPGAVVAVPTAAFVQSQPVARAALRASQDAVARAPVTPVAEVAPMPVSVRGAAPQGRKPPPHVLERPAIVRSAPPAAPVGFAAKERALAGNPGKPLDAAALGALKPVAPVAAPRIQVVAPAQSARPATAPPEQHGKAEQRGKGAEPSVAAPGARPAPPVAAPPDQRGRAEQRAQPTPPVAQPQTVTPPAAAAPPESRGRAEQRGKAMEPPVAAPPARPAPPVAAPPEQRGRFEQRTQPTAPVGQPQTPAPPAAAAPPESRGRAEQHGKAMEPPVAAPPARPAPPVAAPPEQRGRSEQRTQRTAPVAQPQTVTPPAVAAPPESRGRAEQRGKAMEPPVAAPAARPAPPVAAPPEQRARPEQRAQPTAPVAQPHSATPPAAAAPPESRGRAEQRGKAVEQPAAAPPARPAPPVAAPPEQRGRQPKADAAKGESKKTDEQLKLEEEQKKHKQ